MASIEQTQIFTYLYAGGGGVTGYEYFPIGVDSPPSGSKFVIKALNVTINGGATFTTGAQFQVQVAASANGTTIASPIETFNSGTAGENYDSSTPFILIQPYLAVNANVTAACTIVVAVTYLQISASSNVIGQFNVASGVVAANATGTIFTTSTVNSAIFQSIIISNYADPSTTNTYDVSVLLSNGTNYANIGNQILGAGESVISVRPLYLNTQGGTPYILQLLSASGSGSTNLNYYISYTVDQYA